MRRRTAKPRALSAAQVRLALDRLGVGQRDLARAFHVHETSVREWVMEGETGGMPESPASVLMQLLIAHPELCAEIGLEKKSARGRPSRPVGRQT